jgi:rhomboid protease GluP
MLNKNPSDKQHPLESGSPAHLQEGEARTHPLDNLHEPHARPPRFQLVVAFPIRRPYVSYTLIAINCFIFLAGVLSPSLGESAFEFGVLIRRGILARGEYYRLFTSMFLHADVIHLFFNMYTLYVIGRSIEWIFGWRRFLLIYLLGGLAGSLLTLFTIDPRIPSLGASGAIFAVWAAEMVFFYQHRGALGEYARLQLRSLAIVALMNLLFGLTNPRIGTWAHIGGFLGGAALTWWLGPRVNTAVNPDYPGAIIFRSVRFGAALLPVVVYGVVLAGLVLLGGQLLR